MKGNAQVIAKLNELLAGELSAMDQYFIHSRMYDDWGLKKLFERIDHEFEDEKEHASKLIERILFLDGLPNLQSLGKLFIGEHTKEMIECDLKLEMLAIPDLREGIEYAESIKDYVSRELLVYILESEEEHVDWLETQLKLIESVGIENYQQSMI